MMKKKRRRKNLTFLCFIALTLITLTGCALLKAPQMESWTHVVLAANYTDEGTHAVYRLEDSRLNTEDWFDIWMDDSYWDPDLGWSSFEGVYDESEGRFYYEPEYYEGYAEWNAYSTTDIVGATLRFYRLSQP